MRKPFKKLHAIDDLSVAVDNDENLKIMDVKDPKTRQFVTPQKFLRSVEIQDNKIYAICTEKGKQLSTKLKKDQRNLNVSKLSRSVNSNTTQSAINIRKPAADYSTMKFMFKKPKHLEIKNESIGESQPIVDLGIKEIDTYQPGGVSDNDQAFVNIRSKHSQKKRKETLSYGDKPQRERKIGVGWELLRPSESSESLTPGHKFGAKSGFDEAFKLVGMNPNSVQLPSIY